MVKPGIAGDDQQLRKRQFTCIQVILRIITASSSPAYWPFRSLKFAGCLTPSAAIIINLSTGYLLPAGN